jgi:hypothetical protein
MKKVLLASFLVVGFLATSCKKDRTCTCKTTINGVASGTVSGTIKDTKKNAEEECDKGDSTYDLGGSTYVVACEID